MSYIVSKYLNFSVCFNNWMDSVIKDVKLGSRRLVNIHA